MDQEKLKSVIESILFVSGEPISILKISKITKTELSEVEKNVILLQEEYSQKKGLVIIKKENYIQMATNPENSDFVSQLVKNEIQENLSNPALEVLSIVAYRGPVSRAEIEAIRGVNCSFTLRNLMLRGLLERSDNPNDSRSYLYKISFDFLKKMGVDSVQKMPDWENLSKNSRVDDVIGNK